MDINESDSNKVKGLLEKYNDILLNSMSIALSEDLINLIVVNGEDKDFELQSLVKDKTTFRNFVTNEFLKLNAKSVLDDLKNMEEEFDFKMVRDKNNKSVQKKLSL